jgi:hypothetical protein
LKVTGIASRSKTKELGRQAAYDHSLVEIKNFFQSIGGSSSNGFYSSHF